MAKIQDMILYAIQQEYKAADQIINNVERAHAFFELTQACALAIQTQGDTTITTVPETAVVTENTKPVRNKKNKKQTVVQPEPATEESAVVETIAEESAVELTTEPETELTEDAQQDTQEENIQQDIFEEPVKVEDKSDEWTEEAMLEMEDDLREFSAICDELAEYPEGTLSDLIRQATNGKAQSEKEVTPSNIREVIAYVRELQANAVSDEEDSTEEE